MEYDRGVSGRDAGYMGSAMTIVAVVVVMEGDSVVILVAISAQAGV